MDNRSINDLVNEALELWVTITGVDLSKTRWTLGDFGDEFSAYNIKRHTEELNESRTLDPTGLTTFMLLRGLVEGYLKSIAFNAYELILDPSAAEKVLGPLRKMRDVLEDPLVLDLIRGFQDMIRAAALQYKMPLGKPMRGLEDLLKDKYLLAIIRRDALKSLNTLEVHQFVQGTPDKAAPKVTMNVYEFWNVNSLLRALRAQSIPGIALCLVRDPEQVFASFFAIAVRNGQTLSILTDREKTTHPDFWKLARRPDRDFERREALHWFPYNLLVLKATEDQKRLYVNARKALVPYNADAVVLDQLGNIPPGCFIWLSLLFELVRERFFTHNYKTLELSYTGEMVTQPHALVGAEGSLVRDGVYQPLTLEPLTREEVTTESTAAQWHEPCSGLNHWLVERFAHRVPEELMNPHGEGAQKLLAERSASDASFLPADPRAEQYAFFEKERAQLQVASFSPVTFGTKEQIVKDRLWVARVNQMRAIRRLADVEFSAEEDKVLAWCQKAIERNADFLLNAAARGELVTHSYESTFSAPKETEENIVRQYVDTNSFKSANTTLRLGSYAHTSQGYRWCCYEQDVVASVFTVFEPKTAKALAILFGTRVEEMPVFLQHYIRGGKWFGSNHILNRTDPEDWALVNPWNKLHLDICVASSKSALNARRKALGLPKQDWEAVKRSRNNF